MCCSIHVFKKRTHTATHKTSDSRQESDLLRCAGWRRLHNWNVFMFSKVCVFSHTTPQLFQPAILFSALPCSSRYSPSTQWYCTSKYLRVPGHGSPNILLETITLQFCRWLHLCCLELVDVGRCCFIDVRRFHGFRGFRGFVSSAANEAKGRERKRNANE